MGQPKRVWSNKKTVWDGKKSVWLQDGKLKTFDGHWKDANDDLKVYVNERENLPETAELDVYDTLTPEPIGTPEDGIEATYTFKDRDGTILKTGKVKDGETPTPPADPTREATAQYTYTFAGWSPSVGFIYKNTEYIATYTTTVNTYTVTIASNDIDYGTVDESSLTVEYGTAISASNNVLTIGETEVTATAESGYEFGGWSDSLGQELPATVTGNLSVTATFSAVTPPASGFNVTITVSELSAGAVMLQDVTDPEGESIEETLPYTMGFGDGDEVSCEISESEGYGYINFSWNDGENTQDFVMGPLDDSWSQGFLGWQVDGQDITTPYQGTLTSDTTIEPIFDLGNE